MAPSTHALGERYEQAVELAWSADDQARAAGLAILTDLGATGTLVGARSPGVSIQRTFDRRVDGSNVDQ